MSNFICKIFAHKLYNIAWSPTKFTVLCTRCEKRWEPSEEWDSLDEQ
jgi:hypothetical protein